MCEMLASKFAEEYMEKVFYFCLKKTGNSDEADDLTQDIAVNVIASLNKGTVPKNFQAWVWAIARNRYSLWSERKHRKNESECGLDISAADIADEDGDILDEMIHAEQLETMSRELAFIKSDYRNIVVAFYIENKSVRDIASSLSLSVNTVWQRLHRARIILKEGMSMARTFGKRSYAPEQVSFVQNGKDGKKGQPWSILGHLLYKNIFLEVYENPETAEELSLEFGIPLPYMEDELEYLAREELLRKSGNKYETNFTIVSREEQRVEFDANKKIQKPLTDKLCSLIDTYVNAGGKAVNFGYVGYETAKWALLVRAFDKLSCDALKEKEVCDTASASHPRPDDGDWVVTGYETTDWEEPYFVGQHGYLSYNDNEITENIEFYQSKFYVGGLYARTPEHLTYKEAYTLWLVCGGRASECEEFYVKKLLEYGYIKKAGDAILPNVVVFDRGADEEFSEDVGVKLSELKKEILALIKTAPTVTCGYIVEQALEDGWIRYDDDTIAAVGAYIYIG